MSDDADLMAAMPDPPPPLPDRRKLAIEEALRRFDAGADQAPAPASAPARTPVRAFLARPQMAAFATVLLVVLVSSPIWLFGFDRQVRHVASPVPSGAATGETLVPPATAPQVAIAPAPPTIVPVAPALAPPSAARAEGMVAPAPAPEAFADARGDERAPPPPIALSIAPAASAPAMRAAAAKAEQPDQRMALAPPPAQAANAPSGESDTVVVTGSRIERPRTFGRDAIAERTQIVRLPPTDDAWNACTVLDPRKNLRACRDLLDPGQPGATGRAAAYISDGLTAAWKSDLDRAIAAFDRAVAAAPRSSLAYLNRGLAYQLKGDSDRALADLDKAIARDPDSASAYYHRSLLLRAKGEIERADADAARARRLDPRNAAVLEQPGGN